MTARFANPMGALFALSIALLAASVLWLGPEGRIPVDFGPDGGWARSRTVWVLALPAGLLALLWLLFSLTTSRRQSVVETLSPEKRASLDEYVRILGRYFFGFGLILIAMQGLSLINAAFGPVFEREASVRMFFAISGALTAYLGNYLPKIPQIDKKWDPPRFGRFNRFAGWAFTLGGLAVIAAALFAPFERLDNVVLVLNMTMLAGVVIRGVRMAQACRRAAR